MLYKRLVYTVLLIAVTSPVYSASSLDMGIFPYISAAKLIKIHNPLSTYLSEQLKQPVNLVSAPGFNQFIRRTKQQKYDIILTAPHMGALALLQSDYQRLAVSSNKSYAVFFCLKKSAYRSLSQIRQASITMPPEKAIISQLALQTLSGQGMDPDELDIEFTQSHNNALKSVLIGETDIAVIGLPTWDRIPAKEKNKLRKLATSNEIPGFMLLANKNMPLSRVQEISRLLQTYHLTTNGDNYFKTSGLTRFRSISDQDIAELKPFVKSIFKLK